jgi:hypothetical protein
MARRGEAECFDITPEAETNNTKPPTRTTLSKIALRGQYGAEG